MKAACRRARAVALFALLLGPVSLATAQEAAPLQPIPEQTPPAAASPSSGNNQNNQTVCNDDCGSYCDLGLCSPPGRFWLRADYLVWWTSGTDLPPLVTSDALSENPTLYYGNGNYLGDIRSGVHTTVGMWLDPCHVWNLEFDYLTLGEQRSDFSMTSSGNPTVARPFYNMQTGAQDREWIAYNGVSGTVTAEVKDYFQSAGVLVSRQLCSGNCCNTCDECEDPCGPPKLYCCRTDLLVGFRHYGLSDRLGVREFLTQTQTGWTYDVRDDFSVRNEFYGSELGLRTQVYRGRWSLEFLTKVAVGNTHRTVEIGGETTVNTGDATNTYSAGLLATSNTNGGTYHSDAFTVIPQFGFEVGYQVNKHWRAYAGYNIIYWGNIMRSADQIDLQVDPRNLSVPPLTGALPFPAYQGRTNCFWAQGINLGTEFRF